MSKKLSKEDKRQRETFGAIMTPDHIVERMLDMLDKELWSNPHTKICEPSVGDGAFIKGILKRFMTGLEDFEPDPVKRYAWIFERNIYAVDIQQMMIDKCIERFNLQNLKHNFIVANFLTMDVENWKAEKGPIKRKSIYRGIK